MNILFPLQFIDAIPVGADLSKVWPQFAAWLMVDETWGVIRHARTDEQRTIITEVAETYSAGITDSQIWKDVYSRAKKARDAAVYAADAAVYAAAYAADAAVYAAAYARGDHYSAQRDKLLELLASAPVVQEVA